MNKTHSPTYKILQSTASNYQTLQKLKKNSTVTPTANPLRSTTPINSKNMDVAISSYLSSSIDKIKSKIERQNIFEAISKNKDKSLNVNPQKSLDETLNLSAKKSFDNISYLDICKLNKLKNKPQVLKLSEFENSKNKVKLTDKNCFDFSKESQNISYAKKDKIFIQKIIRSNSVDEKTEKSMEQTQKIKKILNKDFYLLQILSKNKFEEKRIKEELLNPIIKKARTLSSPKENTKNPEIRIKNADFETNLTIKINKDKNEKVFGFENANSIGIKVKTNQYSEIHQIQTTKTE